MKKNVFEKFIEDLLHSLKVDQTYAEEKMKQHTDEVMRQFYLGKMWEASDIEVFVKTYLEEIKKVSKDV